MRCGRCGNHVVDLTDTCPSCGAGISYEAPPWAGRESGGGFDYELPPSEMRMLFPEVEVGTYEWATAYASANGGFEPAAVRLKRELHLYLITLALSAISLTIVCLLSETGGTALNAAIVVAVAFGALLLVFMLRLGRVLEGGGGVWLLIILGFVPFVSVFVGLYLLVVLLQRIHLLSEVKAQKQGTLMRNRDLGGAPPTGSEEGKDDFAVAR